MNSPEILQFVDEFVYTKTGKHLNNLQRRIITGILNRQKYADVAETNGYTKHIKKASHELLQMLSEVFGEQVKKSNLESVLERQINVNITLGNKNNRNKNTVNIGSINSCAEPSTPTPDKSQPETPDLHEKIPNKAKIETIDKLRHFGLNDEQIAEALDISLDQVKQLDLEE